jgi:nitroreductase
VRSFTADPISREVLEDLVDCARLAPTAERKEPWEFVVITDPAKKAEVAQATDYGKFIEEAPACIAVFCKPTTHYLEDGAAATVNILTAARAHGLGSCWVAGEKKAYAAQVGEILGAPAGLHLVSLVPVGYTTQQLHPDKRSVVAVTHWDRFGMKQAPPEVPPPAAPPTETEE